ncbi:MAG TPA: hypothetical protein VEA99_00230, partial [Gemmatimonadaceae bacterium]|nr:hypothetical protein [Gemmatimonadaceae bacterium]
MTAPSTFLAETHERFLKAIVARLPLERIIELHLFPSIKQGGTESGVAVVAAVPAGERAVPAVGSALPVSGSAGPATSDEASPADPAPAADAPRAELPLEALVSDDSLPAPLQQPYEAAELAARAEPFDFQAREEIAADTAEASAGIEEEDVERLEEAVEAIEDSLVDSAAQAMAVASLEI